MSSERYICTKEEPWNKSRGDYAEHPDAKYLGDSYWDEYSCEKFECPNCGLYFRVELPQ